MIVDIVLVNYKNSFDTMLCLDSINKSSLEIRKVFLVDNSEKESNEFIGYRSPRFAFEYVLSKSNVGFAAGNNMAIVNSLASFSDCILLLNNDAAIDRDCLKHLLNGFSLDAGIVTGKILYSRNKEVIWGAGGVIDWKKGMGRLEGIDQVDKGQFNKCKEVGFVSGCCMLVKTEVFRKIGLLNEDFFMYLEDVEFCLRAQRNNFKLLYVPEAVIWHKVGASEKPEHYYYFIRNSIFFVNKTANFQHKLIFYFYSPFYYFIKLLIFSLNNPNFLAAYFYAWVDGLAGKLGKNVHAF